MRGAAPAFAPPQLLRRTAVDVSPERRTVGIQALHEVLWQLARVDGMA